MNEHTEDIIAPVAWLPAGLISWYAPGRHPVALVTSWVAVIGGKNPRLRTSWHGNHDPLSRFWPGGDFVYNIPDENDLVNIRKAMQKGVLCLKVGEDLGDECTSGMAAVAPRLTACRVQIECVNGQLVDSGVEPELCADIMRLHRDHVVVDPARIPDLCAINPLSVY